MKIKCMTLFDITKTDVSNRRNQLYEGSTGKDRNQQRNYETLLQIVGLRSQPEDITEPKILKGLDLWGSSYGSKSRKSWCFSFTVSQKSIFSLDGDELGYLKQDCNGVPMIIGLDEDGGLLSTLNSFGEYKNIHFEVDNG